MTLNDYAAPSCQFRDCEADAEETRDHPRHGEVQVCSTCARLWGAADDADGESK